MAPFVFRVDGFGLCVLTRRAVRFFRVVSVSGDDAEDSS